MNQIRVGTRSFTGHIHNVVVGVVVGCFCIKLFSSIIIDRGAFTDDAAADDVFHVPVHYGHLDGFSNNGSDILHEIILCEHLKIY